MPNKPPSTVAKRVTLVSIVGAGVALALAQYVPQEESGRTVAASVKSDGHLQLRNISGREYLTAYLDIVGVRTACDGIAYVPKGAHYTEAQCTIMLENALTTTAQAVMACSPGLAIAADPIVEQRRQGPRFAAVSLAYNVGVGNYCHSSARADFNAGRYAYGCEALKLWNRAGGKIVQGLVNRRAREARVCRYGLGVLR